MAHVNAGAGGGPRLRAGSRHEGPARRRRPTAASLSGSASRIGCRGGGERQRQRAGKGLPGGALGLDPRPHPGCGQPLRDDPGGLSSRPAGPSPGPVRVVLDRRVRMDAQYRRTRRAGLGPPTCPVSVRSRQCAPSAARRTASTPTPNGTGRDAVERDPTNGWGAHAVAHVMEMQGRHEDGIAWLDGLKDHWAELNNFVHHLWWHRSLFHLLRGEFGTVLEIYDPRHPQSRVTADQGQSRSLRRFSECRRPVEASRPVRARRRRPVGRR